MSGNKNDKDLHTVRQEESVARLQRLEATASNLKEARLPDNTEISRAIDQMTDSDTVRQASSDMSPAGKKAMEDLKKTMQAGKNVFIEKNKGDVLQQAVYHGAKAAGGVGGTMQDHLGDRNIAADHFAGTGEIASQAGRRLMDLGRLLVSSSEYRRLLNDLRNLAQDAFGAALSTTAPSASNSEHMPAHLRQEGNYNQHDRRVEGSGIRNDDNTNTSTSTNTNTNINTNTNTDTNTNTNTKLRKLGYRHQLSSEHGREICRQRQFLQSGQPGNQRQ
jgi:hypothetical protein